MLKRAMRLMGSKGGKRAAASMSAAQRKERAKLAGIASGKARAKKAKGKRKGNG